MNEVIPHQISNMVLKCKCNKKCTQLSNTDDNLLLVNNQKYYSSLK